MKGVDSMVRLGIVYEIHSNKVVVLTPDSEFLVIKRSRDMYIGQQVKFHIQDVRKMMKPMNKQASIAASIAAVLVLVFMFSRVPYIGNVYGYIHVDVNPSIEFVVDKEFEVLQTKALNEDAGTIAKELEAKGKDAYSVIAEFMDKCEDYGYIIPEENNVILVSASLNGKNKGNSRNSKDDKVIDAFLLDINKKLNSKKDEDITSRVIKVTPEQRKAAAENKLSMGKYYLIEKARENGVELSVEDLDKDKISDLLAAIDNNNGVIITSDATMDLDKDNTTNVDKTEVEPTKEVSGTIATPTAKVASKPTAKDAVKPTATPAVKPTDEQKVVLSKPTDAVDNVVMPTAEVEEVDNTAKNDSLKIKLLSIERSLKCQIISSKVHIVNTTGTDIDLSKVKARYYFTKEGKSDLESAVYVYGKGNLNNKNYFKQESTGEVKISFHELSGSEMYMEIGFNSGVLKKAEYAYVMVAFNNEDWKTLDQSNDYSYLSNEDKLQETEKVTGYISDKLVWGIEPK